MDVESNSFIEGDAVIDLRRKGISKIQVVKVGDISGWGQAVEIERHGLLAHEEECYRCGNRFRRESLRQIERDETCVYVCELCDTIERVGREAREAEFKRRCGSGSNGA